MASGRNRLRTEDCLQQPRKACVEVLVPERGELGRPLAPLLDHAGLAEGPEVVRHRRLRETGPEIAAGAWLRLRREPPDDLEPMRIAERMKHARELDLVALRVMESGCLIHFHWFDYTTTFELMVRCPSYNEYQGPRNDRPQERKRSGCRRRARHGRTQHPLLPPRRGSRGGVHPRRRPSLTRR